MRNATGDGLTITHSPIRLEYEYDYGCSERLLSHSQILYSAKSRKKQAPYIRFQLVSIFNRNNSFLQLGLLTRF